jgi:hypothetical protein
MPRHLADASGIALIAALIGTSTGGACATDELELADSFAAIELAGGSTAGPYVPGSTYVGHDGYVEYLAGNAPLILVSGHGGYLRPPQMADRRCDTCETVGDDQTQELTREIAAQYRQLTGCQPHVVVNLLDRAKLDPNRDLAEAADGDPGAERAWRDYHGFIASARAAIGSSRMRGLVIDVHGHSHPEQRIELGYLLYTDELRQSDRILDSRAYLALSSIAGLVNDNRQGLSHAALLRGPSSLGGLFAQQRDPAVPSPGDPAPEPWQEYFSGGYTTDRHGSRLGGPTDAIQIEANHRGLRDSVADRRAFARRTAGVLDRYLSLHYPHPSQQRCPDPSTAVPGRAHVVPAY